MYKLLLLNVLKIFILLFSFIPTDQIPVTTNNNGKSKFNMPELIHTNDPSKRKPLYQPPEGDPCIKNGVPCNQFNSAINLTEVASVPYILSIDPCIKNGVPCNDIVVEPIDCTKEPCVEAV